jgi:protein involved in polysaccharide export with SLBB domain
MMTRVLIFFAVAVLAASTFGQNGAALASDRVYLIGPSDEITGKVLGESQFDFVVIVDEDGKIEIPFADQPVTAMCKSERDLRIEVAKLLSRYLKSPQISLQVTKRNSRPPVTVYGEVRNPNQYTLTRQTHLLDVLSAAGGVDSAKSGGMVQVFRTRPPLCSDPAAVEKWKAGSANGLDVPSQLYSLAALRQGSNDANPEILPGDIIVVPKAAPVYITGEVMHPGELAIPSDGLPITQAIAMSSGMTRDAKAKAVKVYRRKAGSPQPEMMLVNFNAIRSGQEKDFMLEPFDIVEVGKGPPSITDIFTGFLIGLPGRIPIPIP